jgi:Secretion system C-terminal sorting domain
LATSKTERNNSYLNQKHKINKMKKSLLILFLSFATYLAKSQGFDSVSVETYYISDANDTMTNADGGILPVGSVTYRIYVDLKPGYKFQAAYGVPGHECRIETSTLFFNNEDRGATTPTFSKTNAKNNTVMIDSWLSVGASCNGYYGVPKNLDDGVATNTNNDGVLQNNDPLAGIPLTVEDGIIASSILPLSVTAVGIATEIAMLDNQNDGTNGPIFSTSNGSWAALGGTFGPDTVLNQILIAQITTDGVFSFKLNIQIGTPSGGVENYVAENPVANEVFDPTLIYPVPVGINSITKTNDFLIYPNPSNGITKIKLFNKAGSNNSIRIYSVNGSTILQKNLGFVEANHMEIVDLTNTKTGLYFIEVITDGMKSVRKLVIQ